MSDADFLKQQQRAVEQMKEMNSRSTTKTGSRTENPKQQSSGIKPNHIPQLNFLNFFKDKDTALILGLLLILYSENADKRLLFALIYILL